MTEVFKTRAHSAVTGRLYNVESMSMQRHDVASKLMRRYLDAACRQQSFLKVKVYLKLRSEILTAGH